MLVPLITAQAVAFWVAAPLALVLALLTVFSVKPVHSALSLAGVMVCLAILYASLDAPFLFVAQIIVYTGAVMMLFLFTMMLIGIDTRESLQATLRGQRVAAVVLVIGLVVMLGLAVLRGVLVEPAGLDTANTQYGGNVQGIAALVFGRYFFAFEATSALLITAALAAMVLAHRERLTPAERQRHRVERRMQEYKAGEFNPGPLPGSGVYARHNSVDFPALLPDGSVAESSLSRTLVARGVAIVEPTGLTMASREAYRAISAVEADLHGELPASTEEESK